MTVESKPQDVVAALIESAEHAADYLIRLDVADRADDEAKAHVMRLLYAVSRIVDVTA